MKGMPRAEQSISSAAIGVIRMAYAKLIGMTLRIDNAGRIVVPKPIRDRLGLRPGTELEVSEGPDGFSFAGRNASHAWSRKATSWSIPESCPQGTRCFKRSTRTAKTGSGRSGHGERTRLLWKRHAVVRHCGGIRLPNTFDSVHRSVRAADPLLETRSRTCVHC